MRGPALRRGQHVVRLESLTYVRSRSLMYESGALAEKFRKIQASNKMWLYVAFLHLERATLGAFKE